MNALTWCHANCSRGRLLGAAWSPVIGVDPVNGADDRGCRSRPHRGRLQVHCNLESALISKLTRMRQRRDSGLLGAAWSPASGADPASGGIQGSITSSILPTIQSSNPPAFCSVFVVGAAAVSFQAGRVKTFPDIQQAFRMPAAPDPAAQRVQKHQRTVLRMHGVAPVD